MWRKERQIMAGFEWTAKRQRAALALADGHTRDAAAAAAAIGTRTLYRWLAHPDFAEAVDRLTLITGLAVRAARVRFAKRRMAQIDQFTKDDILD
jgi:hypothetical protein